MVCCTYITKEGYECIDIPNQDALVTNRKEKNPCQSVSQSVKYMLCRVMVRLILSMNVQPAGVIINT